MEILQHLLESTSTPLLSAFILGIMTAISPCPLATNITAIGFISRELENRKRIFFNGLWYTLGRIISYTVLAFVLYLGASTFHIARFFQANGEKFLGPLLIIAGILMLDIIKINIPAFSKLNQKIEQKQWKSNAWSALILGIIFALAFCPYSGALYFGMLIPLTLSSSEGMLLPVVFALATALPVIIFAYVLAFSISGLGSLYNKVKIFEFWFRRIVAVVFIIVGLWYFVMFFVK